jgi:hypothetical protein
LNRRWLFTTEGAETQKVYLTAEDTENAEKEKIYRKEHNQKVHHRDTEDTEG